MDYKHQYESAKKMVTMYQDEIVPGRWEKIKELEKQMPTWIPVSAKLPFAEYGESEDVLTVDEFGLMRVLYFDGGCWCYPTGETFMRKITHWMPLPEPPSE